MHLKKRQKFILIQKIVGFYEENANHGKTRLGICCCRCSNYLSVVRAVVKHYTEDDAWEELLALDMSISMEDLKAKGFIDVSDVMDTPNNKIEDFVKNAQNRKNCALKIANVIDGRLCAKILVYNKQQDVIKMWTIYTGETAGRYTGEVFQYRCAY